MLNYTYSCYSQFYPLEWFLCTITKSVQFLVLFTVFHLKPKHFTIKKQTQIHKYRLFKNGCFALFYGIWIPTKLIKKVLTIATGWCWAPSWPCWGFLFLCGTGSPWTRRQMGSDPKQIPHPCQFQWDHHLEAAKQIITPTYSTKKVSALLRRASFWPPSY